MRVDDGHLESMLAYHDGFAPQKHIGSELIYSGDMAVTPFVSILIPTYRRPQLLRDAIASALNQDTSIPFEVVIVDNEQDPKISAQVDQAVRSFGRPNLMLYRNTTNIGMYGNWNRCIELARGEWVSILSDDDLLTPQFLPTAADYLTESRLVASSVWHIGRNQPAQNQERRSSIVRPLKALIYMGKDSSATVKPIKFEDVFFGNPVCATLGVLYKKAACVALGGFNGEYWPSADYVFTVRYWVMHGGIILPNKLAKYRWEENESLQAATMIGFLNVDYRFRRCLVRALRAPGWVKTVYLLISNWYQRVQIDISARNAKTVEDANWIRVSAEGAKIRKRRFFDSKITIARLLKVISIVLPARYLELR